MHFSHSHPSFIDNLVYSVIPEVGIDNHKLVMLKMRGEQFIPIQRFTPSIVTLGTRTHIPSGHIVNTLGAQTTCGPNVPSGHILITFKIYPPMWPKCVCQTYSEFAQPLWPQFAQWSHDLSHSKFSLSCDQHVPTQSHPKCNQFM